MRIPLVQTSVGIPLDLYEKLRVRAGHRGVSAVIRSLVAEWLSDELEERSE